MGDLQAFLTNLEVVVEQEIEVEGAWAPARDGVPVAAESGLDPKQRGEQLAGRKLGVHDGSAVQEPRLIEVPDRVGLAEARDRDEVDSGRPRELVERGANGRLALAEVGAEAEVRPGHGATLARLPPARAPATTGAAPLVPSEWWLSHVGADRAEPPGPGVPITIVDSGVDPTHPEFAGRPNTTFLNAQSVTGPAEYHGTIVASLAAAPANGVGIEGLYPQAALQVYDASPSGRGIGDNDAIAGILAAAARCPGVISLSF